MARDLCILLYGMLVGVLTLLLCLVATTPVQSSKVCIPTKTIDGQQIEIRVYTEPLENGGYVINVKRPSDPPGECWGTTIYPMGEK